MDSAAPCLTTSMTTRLSTGVTVAVVAVYFVPASCPRWFYWLLCELWDLLWQQGNVLLWKQCIHYCLPPLPLNAKTCSRRYRPTQAAVNSSVWGWWHFSSGCVLLVVMTWTGKCNSPPSHKFVKFNFFNNKKHFLSEGKLFVHLN